MTSTCLLTKTTRGVWHDDRRASRTSHELPSTSIDDDDVGHNLIHRVFIFLRGKRVQNEKAKEVLRALLSTSLGLALIGPYEYNSRIVWAVTKLLRHNSSESSGQRHGPSIAKRWKTRQAAFGNLLSVLSSSVGLAHCHCQKPSSSPKKKEIPVPSSQVSC